MYFFSAFKCYLSMFSTLLFHCILRCLDGFYQFWCMPVNQYISTSSKHEWCFIC